MSAPAAWKKKMSVTSSKSAQSPNSRKSRAWNQAESVEKRLDRRATMGHTSSPSHVWSERSSVLSLEPLQDLHLSQNITKRSSFWETSGASGHLFSPPPLLGPDSSNTASLSNGSSGLFRDILLRELLALHDRVVDLHEREMQTLQAVSRQSVAQARKVSKIQQLRDQHLNGDPQVRPSQGDLHHIKPSRPEAHADQHVSWDPVVRPSEADLHIKPSRPEAHADQHVSWDPVVSPSEADLHIKPSRPAEEPPEVWTVNGDDTNMAAQRSHPRLGAFDSYSQDSMHPILSDVNEEDSVGFQSWQGSEFRSSIVSHGRQSTSEFSTTHSQEENRRQCIHQELLELKRMIAKQEPSPKASPVASALASAATSIRHGTFCGNGLHNFELVDIWIANQKDKRTMVVGKTMTQHCIAHDDDDSDSDSDDELCCAACSSLIMNPTSGKKFIWDILSSIFVVYEAITTPLTVVDPLDHVLFRIIAWTSRLFWTFDLPLSLLTGYVLPEGNVELRIRKVIKEYLKTWFFLDLFLVITDWMEMFAGGLGNGASAARMVKSLKFLRLIRMLRMMRLFRLDSMPDFVKAIAYYVQGELFAICFGVLRIMSLVVFLSHTIACFFYAIGSVDDVNDGWINSHRFDQTSVFYRYLTAYHWSLTQFAGTMEVSPTNTVERLYSIGVLLFAFVTAAFVVSRITSSLTRLEIATAQRTEKLFTLRRYLSDCDISARLALRIQRNAKFAMSERSRKTPEENIDLLHIVSEPLLVELHFEMHMPILENHPLFRNLSKANPPVMRLCCHEAVMKLSLMRKDIIFNEGEVSNNPKMYFLTSGEAAYKREGSMAQDFCVGEWACEATLWTIWAHFGTLRATSDISLILLDAQKFQEIMVHAQEEHIVKYGKEFVKALNSLNINFISDLEDESMDLEDIANTACPPPGRHFQRMWASKKARSFGSRASAWSVFSSNPIKGLGLGNLLPRLTEGTEHVEQRDSTSTTSSTWKAAESSVSDSVATSLWTKPMPVR